MLLNSLENLAHSDVRARRYLRGKCWPQKKRFCVRCANKTVYKLRERRYRCSRCGYTFHDFTGRWIGELTLPPAKWLWLIKLFELQVPPARIAAELGISYPTAHKAVTLLRCAIFIAFADVQEDESRAQLRAFIARAAQLGRIKESPRLAFGVADRRGAAEITALPDFTYEDLNGKKIAIVKRGAALYSDRYENFDSIIFTGLWGAMPRHRTTRIYTDTSDGFWGFLREQLRRLHGVSQRRFALYLIETQFRYNQRHGELFELLVSYITSLMPNDLRDGHKLSPKIVCPDGETAVS